MSGENILIAIAVGLFAGWLVDLIGADKGFVLAGSLTMGVLGSFIGALVLPFIGLNSGREASGVSVNAALGAALFLLIIKLVRPGDATNNNGDKP